ncbi:MAG: class I SAM-dependent methyltransferase, partial [Candidatus Norongarragalinales archaeon]
FMLPFYEMVVAADISRGMVEVAKRRLGSACSLSFVICDAEHLPFKDGVADFVSVSSVLHHLPKPYKCLAEISRVLKKKGFVYITREPSFQRFRRFFDFFGYFVVGRILRLARLIKPKRSGGIDLNTRIDGLDYGRVDIHYSRGFHSSELSCFLSSHGFSVVSAHSYHWIYPDSNRGWLQTLLTKSNFLVERFPLANRFGRYVSVIAKKVYDGERA